MQYSEKFREKMVAKLVGPGARSATALSVESGVPQATLSRWLRQATLPPMASKDERSAPGKQRRWTTEEKLRVVDEAARIDEADMGAFLRREGLHEADLQRLRDEVREAAREGLQARLPKRGSSAEEKRIRQLEKELRRKEKALAETAALLVLQGKVKAFLEEQEEGNTDGSDER